MDTLNRKFLKRTLAVLLAASLAAPAFADGPRRPGPHGRPAPQRHHDSGAGLALLLGAAVGIAAIAAATAEPAPRPVIVAPPPAPVAVLPPTMAPLPTPYPAYSYWYYCREANGYYPQVGSCPSPWVQIAPGPPPPQPIAY